MLWLVLPQTQGATKLYFEYVHPTLNKHEAEIEEFIARAHDQAKAAGAEYIQRIIEFAKQSLFGALPQAPATAERPLTPALHDAASFARHLFSRWQVPPLTPYAPQMATDFYNFLSSALQQQPGGGPITGGLIPAHVKSPADKARFIELQRQRLKTVMAALESEMESIQGGATGETVSTAAASADEDAGTGGLFKSYSQGHLSTYEGDFDHVSMADATAAAPAAEAASGGLWLWGWGGKAQVAAPAKPHDE